MITNLKQKTKINLERNISMKTNNIYINFDTSLIKDFAIINNPLVKY